MYPFWKGMCQKVPRALKYIILYIPAPQRYFIYELVYIDTNNSTMDSSKEYWETGEEGGARMKGKIDFLLITSHIWIFFLSGYYLLKREDLSSLSLGPRWM